MTTLQITDLPIHDVYPHPQNVRRELRGIDELAASIKAEGLHQPIIVAPASAGTVGDHVDDEEYLIVMGNSRHAACAQLGWETIPCIIRDDLDTEEKVLSAMLAENCARNDLTITEEGDAFQRLLDLDLSAAAVGKRAGRSRKQVTDRVTIASQSDRIRRAVDDKQLTLSHAIALAEFTDDHELYARVEGAIGTPRFEYELERANTIRRHTQVQEKLRADAQASGFTEASERELSAMHKPVGGFQLEWLGSTAPEDGDATIRFTVTSANLEHWPPTIRYYRLVTVQDEPASGPSDGSADPAPGNPTSAHAGPDLAAINEQRRVEAEERKTAANRRRAFLRQLWDVDFAVEDPVWAASVLDLLRMAVAERGYEWEPLTELGVILTHGDGDDIPELRDGDPRLDPAEWSSLRLQFTVWWCRWAAMGERELSNYIPGFWEPETAKYLELLREVLDYELSDIEDALLDTYYAHVASDGDD
ncbi:ParB/RepB/Spo0J family partition protein [Dietzia cercidiphylli]|uniref:ParB-like N-terminal domain-containing protein n=1 Tax=Dietzia cercidiphylli TaxID=498199 RepID=A0ABP4VG50_9ACTN|nr:ParB/RepB/Spo0J family partition protein [Dietzia cercidiphylli]MBB1046435.1 ParB/RepB/Spo0J family partition protein [Dietzia cercidiphylli]